MRQVLLIHSPQERGFIGQIKNAIVAQGVVAITTASTCSTKQRINAAIDRSGATHVIISCPKTVQALVGSELKAGKSVDMEAWAGSVLGWSDGLTVPALVSLPFHYMHSKAWGELVIKQHIKKFLTPHNLQDLHGFTTVTDENAQEALDTLKECSIIAIDIETVNHIVMDMVGYCGKHPTKGYVSYIVNLGMQITEGKMRFVQQANLTPAPKVFHNGCYDNQFFARYHAPVNNYILDTEYMFFCMYAEMPKTLAFVSAFFNPMVRYWKHEADSQRALYCAKDCHNTLVTCELMLKSYPAYALKNYALMFPLTTVVLFMALHGIKVDTRKLAELRTEAEGKVASLERDFHAMCGDLPVNVSSPKQVKALLYDTLGARTVRVKGVVGGTDETTLAKLAEQHPLIERFTSVILELRGNKKALSTYFNAALLNDRMLYSYRVDGTETGRLSCSKSSFGWGNKQSESYGCQVQNIPSYMKAALVPDEGYTLGESDKSQSEARCVGYIANESKLINALESEDDFYLICGKLFFGIPMEKAKPLRQLIKKIIHGSNYCMGAETFIDSVRKDFGTKPLRDAQRILNRPKNESLVTFAQYLLTLYRKTYSNIPVWYDQVQMMLITEGSITSPLGWTRKFLGDPHNNNTLRAAVAHAPQNLSVAIINQAMIRIFWKLMLPSKGEFMLMAQVHDSIVFQAIHEKAEYYQSELNKLMDIGVMFTVDGKPRELRIPTDGNLGNCWKDCH